MQSMPVSLPGTEQSGEKQGWVPGASGDTGTESEQMSWAGGRSVGW